jgi:hypothetical protein
MPSAFVPFLPVAGKANASAASRAGLNTDSARAAGAFSAMVPNTSSGAVNPSNLSPCAHPDNGNATQPTVTLQKDGDRVTHIRIQCSCGEVIELECAY